MQLLARQVVEGFYSGLHRSPHKGASVEFKEHRSYSPGDDIRSIDWKLYGKTDRFYIREYEEETSLRCTLLLDASGSMGYRGSRATSDKRTFAVAAAAALAHLLLSRQNDSVGLVTFDTTVRRYIPPRSQPRHLRVMLEELAGTEPGGETDLAAVFHEIAARLGRRGLLIVLSDLFADVEPLLKSLAHFRHGGHEVLLLQVLDPDELDFPFDQWTQFVDRERSDHRLMLDPAQVRASYLERLAAFQTKLQRGCERQRISLVQLSTDRPVEAALGEYLAMRRRMP